MASGEALSAAVCERFFATMGEVELHNLYGPTEAAVDVSHWKCERGAKQIPIGKPIDNTRLYVLDEKKEPVPIGVWGELYIGGVQVGRGYLKRKELTEEKFVEDPFAGREGARMYRTGDRARWNEKGEVEYQGRLDDQVKVRGNRIELGEIERVLEEHPRVKASVVVVREDGAGEKRLVAYVVGGEERASSRELREHLGRKLPEYMVPGTYVELEKMPLNPSGKVDRKALPEQEAPVGPAESYVGPRDWVEAALVQIWEQLLRLHRVGIYDDFFALGGHSLLAVKLMAGIKQRLGRALPVATLFQARTVAALAAAVHFSAGEASTSPLVVIQGAGTKRPFFCVHPSGGTVLCYEPLARELGPEQPFYGLEARLPGPAEALQATVEDMAKRYLHALREVQPEGPYQLGGWSFGGLVAFAMACRLLREGHQVRALVLFDTQLPAADAPFDPIACLADQAKGYGWQGTAQELRPLGALGAFDRLTREVGAQMGLGETVARRIAANDLASMHAAHGFVPSVYAGPLTLLRAEQVAAGLSPPSADSFDWGKWCEKPVDVRAVPGTHHDMITLPHVAELARALRAVLDAEQ
jgi:thioesterase domain-containing protein